MALCSGVGVIPAAAQTAPPRGLGIDGSATVTSDYRFRGISQTDLDPAVQGTVTVDYGAGGYVGVWASSTHGQIAGGGNAEVDLFAGYRRTLAGTTVDGGLLYYIYPGADGTKADFFEPYLSISHTLGPVSAKIGGNAAWTQSGLAVGGVRRSGAYAYGELSAGIPTIPITLTAHVGRSLVSNRITLAQHYTDWSLTAAYVWRRLTLSVGYADTDRTALVGARRDDIARAGVVGAATIAF